MSKLKKVDLARRNFMKGAALVAGAGVLASCSPKVVETAVPSVPATAVPTTSANQTTVECINPRTAAAYLNPQDYDYRSHTTNLETLFSEWKLGSLTIKKPHGQISGRI